MNWPTMMQFVTDQAESLAVGRYKSKSNISWLFILEKVTRLRVRIYQQRHTPQKENGDTVLQNRQSSDTFGKFDTSQLGEVTEHDVTRHYRTLLTTPTTIDDWPRGPTTTIEKRRRPPTNVHGCPAPPSTHGDDGPPRPLMIGHKNPRP